MRRWPAPHVLRLHRRRSLLIGHQMMRATALRAHLVEFGIVAAQGQLTRLIHPGRDFGLADVA